MTKDIEREAFEALPLAKLALDQDWVRYSEDTNTYYPNEDFCPESAPETMNFAWQSWQAAKAQAVPDGFVLVPKEPSADLVNHGHQVFLGHFNEGGQTGGRSLYFAYKAMIEAQEQAND
ncbi:hypothetical protein [Acinetobacter sp. ANC5681]|uniref:hypothetical protein n=1 Tax=Acinetobacter sp. ANC5681 TaxID=2929504 RepID=UPI00201B2F57|nr:hypothetical protein [Acinetobacter sp. ANC5681]MCL5767395.1 hypothetical protein [Acinetobacter sp. ANC5681]